MPHPAIAKDQVAVVTGGASGIGFAAAKRFLQAGMKVAIADLNADHLARAAELLAHGRKHGIAPADFLPGMISGALMLLALRAVLAGAGWMVPTLCLLAAGGAHLVDVLRRWR